ncbi:hypothetical protein SDC9_185473 [bioreactor metagenome]|uniref:Uncharacterized protein n=1 Tax=bioreactor metagenome TaxID=1076179 RepID=A0A645HHT4_9ZZZZ
MLQTVKETQGVNEYPCHGQAGHHPPLATGLRARNAPFGSQCEAGQRQSGEQKTNGGGSQRRSQFLRHDASRNPGSSPHEHGADQLEIGD